MILDVDEPFVVLVQGGDLPLPASASFATTAQASAFIMLLGPLAEWRILEQVAASRYEERKRSAGWDALLARKVKELKDAWVKA